MIDVWNRVLSNVKVSVSSICKNVNSSNSGNGPNFSALSVTQLDNSTLEPDFNGFENGVNSSIEIQAYSNKSLSEARKIINLACDSMSSMGYSRSYGPTEIKNMEDVNIKRMVARFSRFIGDGDEIEKFKK